MASIYDYLDYRRFLKAFYAERKAKSPAFSYEAFARKAGLKSKGMIHDILNGKRNLTQDCLFKVAEACGLADKTLAYFEVLVAYSQAKTLKEQSFFFNQLKDMTPRAHISRVRDDAYEFYSQWYYSTLRELLPLIRFKGDFDALGRLMNPPISGAQARKALELLLRLGLLEKTRSGYRQVDRLITSGDGVEAMAVRDFHLQNLALATTSIDETAREDRDHSCLIIALDQKGFGALKEEIQAFRKKVLKMSEEQTAPDRIFHVNFLVFPTTRAMGIAESRR